MFKFLATLIVGLALVTPSFATHCDNRIVERVVVNDYNYGYQNVQALVLVPHQNFVVERVVQNYDYQPAVQVVERIVEKERIVNRPKVVERVVERVQNRPVRVRQKIVKKNVIVEQVVEVQKVQKIRSRNAERVRGY